MNTQTVILFSLLGNSSSVGKSMKTPTKPLNPQTNQTQIKFLANFKT